MKRLAVAVSVVSVLVCIAASAASASTVRVAGVQSPPDKSAGKPSDLCRAVDPVTGQTPVLSNTMAGSLIGCWYTDTFTQVKSAPHGNILAIGTEHFVGCVDANRSHSCSGSDPHGTLALIYVFEGQFDKKGNEIHGGCQHVIVGGTAGFAQASGRIDFTDRPANGTSVYRGRITFAESSPHTRTAHAVSASIGTAC